MAEITELTIINIKKKVEDCKSQLSRAQGQKAEMEKTLATKTKELEEMGIDPDNAEEFISQMKSDLEQQYESINAAVIEIENALRQAEFGATIT